MTEKQQTQQPVIDVMIEVECKKCGTRHHVEVPVVCDLNASVQNGQLVCDLAAEMKSLIPPCKCGENDYEVKKQEIKSVTGTGG